MLEASDYLKPPGVTTSLIFSSPGIDLSHSLQQNSILPETLLISLTKHYTSVCEGIGRVAKNVHTPSGECSH